MSYYILLEITRTKEQVLEGVLSRVCSRERWQRYPFWSLRKKDLANSAT